MRQRAVGTPGSLQCDANAAGQGDHAYASLGARLLTDAGRTATKTLTLTDAEL